MLQSQTLVKSTLSKRVRDLRRYLKLSRAALAKDVGVSPETVAGWERGTKEPSSTSYLQLGNLAEEPSCWSFWESAGLYRRDIVRVLPAVRLQIGSGKRPDLQVARAGSGEHLFSKPQLHAIPLLPIHAATPGQEGDKAIDFDRIAPQGLIAAPSHWAPNPAFTSCLRVRGDSMSPMLCDGYIIVIDTSVTDHSELIDKMVVASHREKGLTVSWLKMAADGEALVAENAEYGSVVLNQEKGWRIIGKVIWWIGRDG